MKNWFIGFVLSAIFVVLAGIETMFARDIDGHYAAQDPALHEWFESLKSSIGYCCAEADGMPLESGNWSGEGKHFRVLVPSAGVGMFTPRFSSDLIWLDVPNAALVDQPNRTNKAMVWVTWPHGAPEIRCFLAGSMS